MVRVQPIGQTLRTAMHKSPPRRLAGGAIAHEAHVGPPMPGPRGPDIEVSEGLPRQAPSVAIAWPSLGRNSHEPRDRELDWPMTAPLTNPAIAHCWAPTRIQCEVFYRGALGLLVQQKGTAGIMVYVLPAGWSECASKVAGECKFAHRGGGAPEGFFPFAPYVCVHMG